MCITFGCVKEQITDTGTTDVQMFGSDVSEDNTGGHFATCPEFGSALEMNFTQVRETQEPQNAVWNRSKNTKPGAEGGRFNLVRWLTYDGMW